MVRSNLEHKSPKSFLHHAQIITIFDPGRQRIFAPASSQNTNPRSTPKSTQIPISRTSPSPNRSLNPQLRRPQSAPRACGCWRIGVFGQALIRNKPMKRLSLLAAALLVLSAYACAAVAAVNGDAQALSIARQAQSIAAAKKEKKRGQVFCCHIIEREKGSGKGVRSFVATS